MRTEAFASPLTVWVGSRSYTFAPGRDVTVGHDNRSDVRLDDRGSGWTEPIHLVLRFTGHHWVAVDQSRHGIYVDGTRMPTVNIRDGQNITVGDPQHGPRLLFRLGASAQAAGGPPKTAPRGPGRPAPPPPAASRQPGQQAQRRPPAPPPPNQPRWRQPPPNQGARPMRPPPPPPQRRPPRPPEQPPSQTPTRPVRIPPPQEKKPRSDDAPSGAAPTGSAPRESAPPPEKPSPRPEPPSELPTRPVPAPQQAASPQGPRPPTQPPPRPHTPPPAPPAPPEAPPPPAEQEPVAAPVPPPAAPDQMPQAAEMRFLTADHHAPSEHEAPSGEQQPAEPSPPSLQAAHGKGQELAERVAGAMQKLLPRPSARPHEEAATTRLPAGERVADAPPTADEAPVSRPAPRAREMRAYELGLAGEGRGLLDDVSFTATRGTLTAVVGPTSAALSALVGMVGGAVQPSVGQVILDGHDVNAEYMRRYVGMVPRGDLIHAQLTVEQALRYAAELRLPPGTSADERRRAVNEVLRELALTSQRTVQVGKLSDEQRRRATVAMELLTRPPLLVLDEPTAGLEPALERQMMATLRRLADSGQIVVLATTSPRHLDLCDQVVLLTSGGTTAFAGPPDEIDAAMGTSDWSRILEWVSTDPDGAHQAFVDHRQVAPPPEPAAPLGRPARLSLGRQIAVAARRQAWLIFGDQRYAIFLTILPLFFGALALVAPGDTGLSAADPYGNGPDEPVEILTVLDIAAVCMGTALTIRDLISERNIFRREQYVGLSTSAYLTAKILVCSAVVAAQTAFLTIIVMLGKGAPTHGAALLGSAPFELYVTVTATAIVSVIVGLLLSSVARYKQLILPIGVLLILLSLMFSGAMFPLADRDGVQQVSWLFPSRWGFAASASTVDLHSIAPLADYDALWAHSAGRWLFDMAMLLLLAAVATSLVWWQLRSPARPKKVEPAPQQ